MAESSLFQTVLPHQPIDVMLLVENSQAMSHIWDDLRDRYLSRLMERLKVANDPLPAPPTVWVLESQPLQTSSTALPRQYNDPHAALRDVRLNYLPENRLSYNKVDEAVNFLSSLRCSGEPRALHLIVVAASSPAACIDVTGREIITHPSGFSPWYSLAHKLAQASIFCHMLIRSTSEDTTALTDLFEETLRSQSNIEDLVTFPSDSQFTIRLSMSPRKQGQFNPPPRPQRIPMPPRRNTFPLEPGYLPQYEDPYSPARPVDMEGSPSLVSQLQQVHGLTKKKVYGAKPARQPFVSDEALAYTAGPPLAVPAYSHDGTLPPSSGRAMSQSKADRLARLAQASPTGADSQGRYLPVVWARRGSCVSSPEEADGVISPTSIASFADTSPPTSYMSSNMSSPISPASIDDYYGLPTAASSMPPPSAVNGGGPDPTWLQSPYAASYSQASIATVPPNYYMSPPNPVPPTYHDGGMYMAHDYSMPPQLPPPGMAPPKGLAIPPMVIGSNNKHPPPKSSNIEIPPPPGAEISAAPSSHHHHHASSERRTGSSTSKTATSNASSGSTSSAASASSSSSSATSTLPPPPPVPATASSSSSSKTTAATSSSSATKKTRLPRPEDDEYFEFNQDYVKETTDMFNAFFPNTENFPDSKVSPSSGTNTTMTSTSSSTSTISSSTPPTVSSPATSTSTIGATITSSSPSSGPVSTSASSSTGVTTVTTPPGSGGSTSATPPGTASPGRNGTKSKSSKTVPGSPSIKPKGKKATTAGGGIQKRRGTTGSSGGSHSKLGSSHNGVPSTSPSSSPKISNPSSTNAVGASTSSGTTSGSVGSITSGVGVVASGPSSSDTNGIIPPPGSFASGIGTVPVGVGVPPGGMLYGGTSASGGVIPPPSTSSVVLSAKSQGIIPSASLPTREPLSGVMVGGGSGGGGLQIPPPLPLAKYSAGAAANGYLQNHQLPLPPLPLSAPPPSSYQPQYSTQMSGEYHRYQQQQLHPPPPLPPSALPLSNTAATATNTAVNAATSLALYNHHAHLESISAGSGVPPSYYTPAGYQYSHLAPAASGSPGTTSSLTGWAG